MKTPTLAAINAPLQQAKSAVDRLTSSSGTVAYAELKAESKRLGGPAGEMLKHLVDRFTPTDEVTTNIFIAYPPEVFSADTVGEMQRTFAVAQARLARVLGVDERLNTEAEKQTLLEEGRMAVQIGDFFHLTTIAVQSALKKDE